LQESHLSGLLKAHGFESARSSIGSNKEEILTGPAAMCIHCVCMALHSLPEHSCRVLMFVECLTFQATNDKRT